MTVAFRFEFQSKPPDRLTIDDKRSSKINDDEQLWSRLINNDQLLIRFYCEKIDILRSKLSFLGFKMVVAWQSQYFHHDYHKRPKLSSSKFY